MRDEKMSIGAIVASITSGIYAIGFLVEFVILINALGGRNDIAGVLVLGLLFLIFVSVTFALNIVLANKAFKKASNLYKFAVAPLILNFILIICNILTCIINPSVSSIVTNVLVAFFLIMSVCYIIGSLNDYEKTMNPQAVNENYDEEYTDEEYDEDYEEPETDEAFDNFVNKLNKLNELKKNNLITEDEYNKVKNKLLEDI